MSEAGAVLAALENVERVGNRQWEASCPVPGHGRGSGDQNASFSVGVGDDGLATVYCHGGCSYGAIRNALSTAGVPAAALRRGGRREPVTTVRTLRAVPDPVPDGALPGVLTGAHRDWLHARGITDATIARFGIGSTGSRVALPVRAGREVVDVRQHATGPGGNKTLHLKGHGKAVLYPEQVLREDARPVLLCEGELDALIAGQHSNGHYVAVSGTGGASSPPQDLSRLRGHDVWVAYDADDAGVRGAEKVAEALRKVGAASVHVLDLTRLGLPFGDKTCKDITDYFVQCGGTGAALLAEMDRMRPRAREPFEFVSAATLARPVPPMRWLVRGVWPEKSYGVLAGEKKTLKTYTLLHMALAVASGEKMYDYFATPEPGPVVYFLAEGGQGPTASRLQRIARTMGVPLAELPLYMAYDSAPTDSEDFRDAVQVAMDTFQPSLMIVDPLYAFHPAGIEAQNLYARGQMLADLQATVSSDTALIVADHFRKNGGGELDLDSIAQAGMSQWADSWMLQRHRDRPDVDAGTFALEVEMGSRQWGGRRWQVDWDLGRFDDETGEHVGDVAWAVSPGATSRTVTSDPPLAEAILERLSGTPKSKAAVLGLPASDGGIRGGTAGKRAVWDQLAVSGHIRSVGKKPGRGGGELWEVVPVADRKIHLSATGESA